MTDAGIPGAHVEDFGPAGAELPHHGPHIAFRHLDHQQLHRFEQVPLRVPLVDDLRTADRELEALAPHGLDED